MLILLLFTIATVLGIIPVTSNDSSWEQLEKARQEDRPEDEIRILNSIRIKAEKKHDTWNFYRAWDEIVNTESRRNWKRFDSLYARMDAELDRFGEPVAIFYRKHSGKEFITENESRLKEGVHREFWAHDYAISGKPGSKAILKALRNDWEYACYVCGMTECFRDRYPIDAIMEFEKTGDGDLPSFVARYSGKAVSLLARQDILAHRLYREGEDFNALRSDCELFEKERKSFRGSEALIADDCTRVKDILSTLESRDLFISISGDELQLTFRNLHRAEVRIEGKDGKTVWRGSVENGKRSFYALDTVSTRLPHIADGDYSYTADAAYGIRRKGSYNKRSISLAVRRNASGRGIYAADHISGKPFERIGLRLLDSEGKIVETVGELPLEKGFTPLPDSFAYRLESEKGFSISAFRDDRLSPEIHLYGENTAVQDISEKPVRHCLILTDRAAFNPDETLHFKCILYEGRFNLRPTPGLQVDAVLMDSERNEIGRQSLLSNENGSVAGQFKLVRGKRGGLYSLSIIDSGGGTLASRRIRVDDFILPDFEVVFDKGDEFLTGDPGILTVSGRAAAYSGHSLSDAAISYTVTRYGEECAAGTLRIGQDARFNFSFPTVGRNERRFYDSYRINVKVSDLTGETREFTKFIVISGDPEPEDRPEEHQFREKDGDDIRLEVISADRITWAVAELYGSGNVLLDKRFVEFVGKTEIAFDFKPSYPPTVSLCVLYFQDGQTWSYTMRKVRPDHSLDLPLSFSRFTDTAIPGSRCEIVVRTGTGVECAATVFDKSSETVTANGWNAVPAPEYPAPNVSTYSAGGFDRCTEAQYVSIRGGLRHNDLMKSSATAAMSEGNGEPDSAYIRKDFDKTTAWFPVLLPDSEGNVHFSFTASDRLSTYCVQLFAHGEGMRNGVIRKEMKITVPVRVSVIGPAFLYEGDRLIVSASVSNSLGENVQGEVKFNDSTSVRVSVPAGGSTAATCTLEASADGQIPLKVVFRADNPEFGSDGMLVRIPVRKAAGTFTESHSTVIRAGADRKAAERELRSRFVNIPGEAATAREISIGKMLEEAFPEKVEPSGDNTIALAEAVLARHLLGMDSSGLITRILSRRGSDGGFVWLDGMNESPLVTAVVLELLHGILPDAGMSVRYLDRVYQGPGYLYLRSLYPEVPLEEKPVRAVRRQNRKYLCPGRETGYNGMVFLKARRAATLKALNASPEGRELARKSGLGMLAASRMNRSALREMKTLRQYAVDHPSGGTYFPNAVLPWRGLLESELYAHVLLCRLFEGENIADGIRLWMMVQKETQQWGSDPAYIEALQTVMEGSEELGRTGILALSGTYEKPFDDVMESGNGITVRTGADGKPETGGSVTVRTVVTSEENRSFVKVTLPFPAAMVPTDQMSGYCGRGCYRSVLKDRIEYWFDTFPEGGTVLEEKFFVQRAGEFHCPCAQAVCLYADHYRANTASPALYRVEK